MAQRETPAVGGDWTKGARWLQQGELLPARRNPGSAEPGRGGREEVQVGAIAGAKVNRGKEAGGRNKLGLKGQRAIAGHKDLEIEADGPAGCGRK